MAKLLSKRRKARRVKITTRAQRTFCWMYQRYPERQDNSTYKTKQSTNYVVLNPKVQYKAKYKKTPRSTVIRYSDPSEFTRGTPGRSRAYGRPVPSRQPGWGSPNQCRRGGPTYIVCGSHTMRLGWHRRRLVYGRWESTTYSLDSPRFYMWSTWNFQSFQSRGAESTTPLLDSVDPSIRLLKS